MPDIDQLNTLSSLDDTDSIPVWDADETDPIKLKRITFANFKTGFEGFTPHQLVVAELSESTVLTVAQCNRVLFVTGEYTITLPDAPYGTWVWVKNTASTAVNVTIAAGDGAAMASGAATTIAQGKCRLYVYSLYTISTDPLITDDVWYEMVQWD